MLEHVSTSIGLTGVNSSYGIICAVCADKTLNCKYHRNASHIFSEEVIDVDSDIVEELYAQSVDNHEDHFVFRNGTTICEITVHGRREPDSARDYTLRLSGNDPNELKVLEEKIRGMLPEPVITDDRLPLTFWTLTGRGPIPTSRKLVVPEWEEVEVNYPGEVGDKLTTLMDVRPGNIGRLILLHGTPGTGKSWAIRALLKEWSEWCRGHYIVDPDRFFGSSAEYMTGVLLSGGDESEDESKGWRLFVIEDGDEFLTGDAKIRSGQALSRLLNVVDGMIGQGLKVMVLITTNEPLDSVHPAVTRPGRCLANIEFRKFNTTEASEWLNGDGHRVDHSGEGSLAELYFKLHQANGNLGLEVEPRAQIGFAN